MYTRDVMPDLTHRLSTHDLGFLKIVADFWGIDLAAPDARTAVPELVHLLLDPSLVADIVASLPQETRQALDALIINDGWMPWSRFTGQFGSKREMGPGRRDREKPYLDPVSPVETLWYRGLIGRDFLRREGLLQECAYIPDDLLERMPPVTPKGPLPPGRPASPGETAYVIEATDRILDHTCTLLAALRMGDARRSPALANWQPPFEFVHALLGAVKLITSSEQPVPEDAQPFLEMPRGEALAWLVRGWRESMLFNELRLLPGVICDGTWQNDPSTTRQNILSHLGDVPEGKWWHLESFIKAVNESQPDFQRPAGDFDSWLLRDAISGESLAGIKHWDDVDGALLRYLITGPMHWLGLMDLASPAEGDPVSAFRFSAWAAALLMGQSAKGLMDEDQLIEVFSDGVLKASTLTPRLARYQIARFCLWIDETSSQYFYQTTPASLSQAAEQGLKIVHLEKLLKKHGQTLPPILLRALQQWQKSGSQVRIHPAMILRVETPQILQALRDSPAGRFLGEALGPTSVMIHPQAVEKVASALTRLGYLSDIESIEAWMADQLSEEG